MCFSDRETAPCKEAPDLALCAELFYEDGGPEWIDDAAPKNADLAVSLKPRARGLCRFSFAPALSGGESGASASFDSVYGTVRTDWKRKSGEIFLNAECPAAMRCEVRLISQHKGDQTTEFRIAGTAEKEENGRRFVSWRIRSYKIRPMKQTDEAAVRRFYDTLSETSTAFFNVNHGNERRTLEFFENGKPDHRFFVIDAGEELAGIAFIWDIHTRIPWFGIAVHDDFQHMGLGTALLGAVLAACREQNCGGVLLRTAVANLPAQRLYEKNGFERIGTHPSGELLYLKRFLKE